MQAYVVVLLWRCAKCKTPRAKVMAMAWKIRQRKAMAYPEG